MCQQLQLHSCFSRQQMHQSSPPQEESRLCFVPRRWAKYTRGESSGETYCIDSQKTQHACALHHGYPTGQVVRSRLQQRMARRAIQYRSGWDVLRITLRREGVGGLYKGLLPNVLRVMPQVRNSFRALHT